VPHYWEDKLGPLKFGDAVALLAMMLALLACLVLWTLVAVFEDSTRLNREFVGMLRLGVYSAISGLVSALYLIARKVCSRRREAFSARVIFFVLLCAVADGVTLAFCAAGGWLQWL
jgi:chromate transport protein ChrA